MFSKYEIAVSSIGQSVTKEDKNHHPVISLLNTPIPVFLISVDDVSLI